ncbi:hypothetical protein COTS27_01589 [Spirochaetota bacterium]|nr:hypothetical protein COTS27_01589 [Spirochaetota bacterium]
MRGVFVYLPNIITFLRVVLTLVLLYVWFFGEWFVLESVRFLTVLILYSLAAVTDYLDGFFARYYNRVSTLGKWFDPIADKVLVLAVFVGFLFYPPIRLWWWMVALIAVREVWVIGLRVFNRTTYFSIASDQHAKVKTFLQMASQFLLILMLFVTAIVYDSTSFKEYLALESSRDALPAARTMTFEEVPFSVWEHYFSLTLGLPVTWAALYRHIPNILIFITTCVTVYSGILYTYKVIPYWKLGSQARRKTK